MRTPPTRRVAPPAALAAALAALALLLPGSAAADTGVGVEQAQKEVDRALILVGRSVEAAEAGRREQGYDVARSAYLDHFELVEIPLRLRNANLVLDLELPSPTCATGSATAPRWRGEGHEREVAPGLRDVKRELESEGFAAPLLAFASPSAILFREGLEAVLLIAVLLGSLEAAAGGGLSPSARLGHRRSCGGDRLTYPLRLRDRHRPGQQGGAGGDHRARRGGRARAGQLLADVPARAPALDGVHARPRGGGDSHRQRDRVRRPRVHRGLPRGLRDGALLPGARLLRRGPRGVGDPGRRRRRCWRWGPSGSRSSSSAAGCR